MGWSAMLALDSVGTLLSSISASAISGWVFGRAVLLAYRLVSNTPPCVRVGHYQSVSLNGKQEQYYPLDTSLRYDSWYSCYPMRKRSCE